MFPKDGDMVTLETLVATYYQEADSCQEHSDEGQTLTLRTDDAGGGKFLLISTDRWAIDADDIPPFARLLEKFMVMACDECAEDSSTQDVSVDDNVDYGDDQFTAWNEA
jgi:hypothetical protein